MTTQHTQGRLIVRNGYSLYAADGKTPVADTCLTNSMPENDEANARRLVACWNACEGIPTEMLEAVCKVPLAAVMLAEQRDELLEALKWTARVLDKEHPAALKARAAITKVEGKS